MKIVYKRPPQVYSHPKQLKFIEARVPQLFCKGGTKSGKTVAMILFCIEFAIELEQKGIKDANIWWIAPTYPVAEIAMKRMWTYIPDGYKPYFKKNEYKKYIQFPKNIKIWFKSGDKPDRLYGEDVYAVVIDEASRVTEDVLDAAVSVLTATNGLLRCIGNSKGQKNWFYHQCEAAKEHAELAKKNNVEPQKIYMEMNTTDNPKIDAETIEIAKNTLSKKRFDELYYNTISQEGDRAYDDYLLNSCLIPDLSNNPPIVFGVDIGKVTDYTVIIGLDDEGHLAYFDRFKGKHISNATIAKRIIDAVNVESNILTLVDGTGIYNMIADTVQKKLGNRKCKIIYIGGSNYNQNNGRFVRQHELERLQMAMEYGYVKFPKIIAGHSTVLYDEFASMELVDTNRKSAGEKLEYHAPHGKHDDCVMAMAIATRAFLKVKRIKLSNFPDLEISMV